MTTIEGIVHDSEKQPIAAAPLSFLAFDGDAKSAASQSVQDHNDGQDSTFHRGGEFLCIFLLAMAAVVLTHLPRGVGIFELVILTMLGTKRSIWFIGMATISIASKD